MTRIIVLGSGIIGSAIARTLSAYDFNILILEKNCDIIRLRNKKGLASIRPQDKDDDERRFSSYDSFSYISEELQLDLKDDKIDPYLLTIRRIQNAVDNGAKLKLDMTVKKIKVGPENLIVETETEKFEADIVIDTTKQILTKPKSLIQTYPEGIISIGQFKHGVSASPKVAFEILKVLAASGIKLNKKESFSPNIDKPKRFSQMDLKDKENAIRQNPKYGTIISSKYLITEAEAINEIAQPYGAKTLEGLKIRLGIADELNLDSYFEEQLTLILSKELNIPLENIKKDCQKEKLFEGKTK